MNSTRDSQKTELPLGRPIEAPRGGKHSRSARIGAILTCVVVLYPLVCSLTGHRQGVHHNSYGVQTASPGILCPQVDPILPSSETNRKLAEKLGAAFADSSFEAVAAEYLGGAVRIPTESYDVMEPVGTDPRWEVFYKFSEHLLKTYPKVHATLIQTRINTHALLYHWPGSDSALKPILLTAHQDVVPVDPDTVNSWIHPPYSGYYDGTWVWGRGSVDDKSGLVGIMVTLEKLIESGFEPKRGILIGFGIDEESAGVNGAHRISKYIEEHYGKDSVSMLVDEGSEIENFGGISVALPAVGEKGYFDLGIEVSTPGGHSSVPPAHTTIGILASIIAEIESTPYTPVLSRSSPIYGLLQCTVAHIPSTPSSLRSSVIRSICPPNASTNQIRECDEALHEVERALFDAGSDLNRGNEEKAMLYRSLLGTTQAVDMVKGGVKANALPETASAVVNHRIRTDSSVSALQGAIMTKLLPLVKKYNLTLTAFSQANLTTGGSGTIVLSDAFGTALEPAPVSPTEGSEAAAYRLLSGVIKRTRGSNTVVSPALMGGNTDTQFYWNLTRNIFRYSHISEEDTYDGIHTINEGKSTRLFGRILLNPNVAMRAKGFVEMIQFFKNLILTADDATDI